MLEGFKAGASQLTQALVKRLDMTGPTALSGTFRGSDAPPRGAEGLLKSHNNSPWLSQVVTKIAEHVAATCWTMSVVRGPASRSRAKHRKPMAHRGLQRATSPQARRAILARLKRQDVVIEELPTHPLLDLLTEPNEAMSGQALFEVTQKTVSTHGEYFWWTTRDAAGLPIELWPMPPTWVRDVPSSKEGGAFEVSVRNGQKKLSVPVGEMVWFRQLDAEDPWGRGKGRGYALADELDTDEYASKVAKNLFYNRGAPDMLLGIEGVRDKEQLRVYEREFEERHRGFWNAYRPHFYSGKLTLHQLQQSFADMELLKLRDWEREAFRSMYGVPPEILGLTGQSNRATVIESRKIFAAEVLIPALEFLRFVMQMTLVSAYNEPSLLLGYESPMPDDDEFRLRAYQAAPYAATRGEWRELQGLENRGDDDDVHMQPLGLEPVRPDGTFVDEGAGGSDDDAADGERSAAPPRMVAPAAPQEQRAWVEKGPALADKALEKLRAVALSKRLEPEWRKRIQAIADQIFEDLDATGSFNMQNPLVREHLDEFATDRMTSITETTRRSLRAALVEGFAAGEGAEDLAKRIQTVFRIASRNRARTIARTEVVRSQNFGTWVAHKESGLVDERQWVATQDDRTRDAHIELHGEVVGIDELFEIDGATAMHPGQFGVAALDINCRCTTIAVIEEPRSAEDLAAVWRVFDRESRKWERAGVRLIRQGFAEQEEAVTAALLSLLG